MPESSSLQSLGRRLFARAFTREAPRARVVSVASGKGGVGKSVIASNLAVARARMGESVLLIDCDAGLANAHLLLGLSPKHDLAAVMEGRISPFDAMVPGPEGIALLSGGVGRTELAQPSRRELEKLFRALRPVEERFDRIVIDHGAGLGYGTLTHLAAATTLLLVTGHEVTALSDGYALFKRASAANPSLRAGLVINRVPRAELAQSAWERFSGACRKFLGTAPELIGWVPADDAVLLSVEDREPLVLTRPQSPAARAIARVAAWRALDHPASTSAFYDSACAALR